jgi:hypothetical protein
VDKLVALLVAWLSSGYGLPVPEQTPRVVLSDPAALVAREQALASTGRQVLGAHDDRTSTIHLRRDWDRRDPIDVSILVHELVHNMQHAGRLRYDCPEAREALAYAAQADWLTAFGYDLESAFGIDALTLKLSTECLPW